MGGREYWMIYRWPGFLAVVWVGWVGSSPTLPPPVSKLVRRHKGRLRKLSSCWHERERMEGGGRGAESEDCKKVWSSINQSILSEGSRVLTASCERGCIVLQTPRVGDINVCWVLKLRNRIRAMHCQLMQPVWQPPILESTSLFSLCDK